MGLAYILIMVWSANVTHGAAIAVVQQRFATEAACHHARTELAKAHNGRERVLAAQGCFPEHKGN
jgi:hypothetical protein